MKAVKIAAQPVKNVPPIDLTVRNLGLSGIAISPRRRALRPDAVDSLAASMKEIGLIHPITVRPAEGLGFCLITGRHRYEGAKLLKWKSIPAIVLEGLDADEAELREIDENLIRADLTDAERAAHHARRQQLHQQKHPETKHGGDRKGKKSSGQNGHSNERYTRKLPLKLANPSEQFGVMWRVERRSRMSPM
jgi:ParB-like chromosome segregation protein Spo0J